MADIELLFGVKGGGDISGPSGKGIKDDLEKIVKAIEPLTIKVEADQTSIKDFEKHITSLADHSVKEAKRAQLAWSKVPPNPGGGGGGGGGGKKKNDTLAKDTTEYYKAVTRLEKMQTSLREDLRKWTGAENGKSSSDYKNLQLQEKRLLALSKALETGKLKAEQFEKYFSKVSASIAVSADNINFEEENISALNEATNAVKEFYKAQKDAIKFGDEIGRDATGVWTTQNKQLESIVQRLKDAEAAYQQAEVAILSLSDSAQEAFYRTEATERQSYNEAYDKREYAKQFNKETADIKEATKAIKEYYGAQREAIKHGDAITRNGLGEYETQDKNLKALVTRLNDTRKAYIEAAKAAVGFSDANKAAYNDAERAARQSYNEASQDQSRKNASKDEAKQKADEAAAVDKATKAIKEYYGAQREAIKHGDAITRNAATGLWTTQDEQLKSLVKRLNETREAYIDVAKAAAAFSDADKATFNATEKAARQSYNEAVEDQNRKNIASDEAKKKTEEAEAVKKATDAIKEYYKAQTDCLKLNADMSRGDDGKWVSLSGRFSELAERLNRVQEAFDAAQEAKDGFSAEGRADVIAQEVVEQERLNEAIEAQRRAMEGADIKAYRDQVDKVDTLLVKSKKNLEAWSAAKTGKSSEAYRGLEEMVRKLEEMRNELKNGGVALEGFDDKFDEIAASTKRFGAEIELAGENVKSTSNRIKDLFDKLGVSFTIADAFHKAIEIGQQMVETVTEIDTAMTELKKVTDETDATYDRFLSDAEPRARALGATVADVVSATADFSRLGNNIPDASDLADAAIVYKNVGDGIEDISTASESIISTMQAFKIEAKDAMSIVDSFNAVGM